MLKLIYSLFLGVLIALFVGVGIETFYPQPPSPRAPAELELMGKEPTANQLQVERAFNARQADWQQQMRPYNRNVSLITLTSAIILVAASILLEHRIKILADGIMLGGLLTLLYSIGRGFAAQDPKYSFMVITAGLIIALVLGYLRFIRPQTP